MSSEYEHCICRTGFTSERVSQGSEEREMTDRATCESWHGPGCKNVGGIGKVRWLSWRKYRTRRVRERERGKRGRDR